MKYDHDKEWKDWEGRVAIIKNAVDKINGITTEVKVPPLGNVTPTLHVTWDKSKVKITTKDNRNLINILVSPQLIRMLGNHLGKFLHEK